MKGNVLWDGGSTLSLITNQLAQVLHLKGRNVTLSMMTVGGHVKVTETCEYKVSLIDENGKNVIVNAIGIERISSPISGVDLEGIANIFAIEATSINRPVRGEIDMLIGLQYAAYHPVQFKAQGHLLMYKNRFGMTIGGTHPKLNERTTLDKSCLQVQHAIVGHTMEATNQFFEIEGLGVTCSPKCGSCKCGMCHPGGKNMSLKDEKEYNLIESKLQFNTERGRWMAEYPWIRDPHELKNNRHVALAVLKSTEKKLLQNKEHKQLYGRQIQDMIDRKAARRVTEEELDTYGGPKFYLTHHAVMRSESKSTPCRIVFHSSLRYLGLSLNDCLAKGPSMLNGMLGIWLRFRQGKRAFIGDIAKMYHSIDIPEFDQMTHLFLWRDCDTNAIPETFAMTVLNMGDRPSSTIAQVALRKSAEEAKEEYPEAAGIILQNSYMDDIPASTDSDEEVEKRMQEIEVILKRKGFKIKEWIHKGAMASKLSKDQEQVQLLMGLNDNDDTTEGVLGMRWQVMTDSLKFKVNIVKKGNKITKRTILSIVNSLYDPLGLLTPFTVKPKILLRKIWAHEPKLGWDDEVPKNIKDEWLTILAEITELSDITLRRSLKPEEETIGNPTLVIFSDGSEQAYGTAAYIRWRIGEDKYVSQIIMAKCRIAPLKTIDIVRLELCGAVLSTRIRCTILKEMNIVFEKVMHIIDSEIVHAMIHRESYGFKTFAANRIGEIHESTNVNEWMWVQGKSWLNVADMTTRGCSPKELGVESIWQRGPSFLSQPEQEWPVQREINKNVKVIEVKRKDESQHSFVGVLDNVETLANRINAKRFSKWRLLLLTTARILKLYERFKQDSHVSMEITAKDIATAEEFWIKEAQAELNTKQLTRFRPREESGIIIVGGRTERWMACTWNKQKFVLLPKNNHISCLIAKYEHAQGGHLGLMASISKTRRKYWIIGIKLMMKHIMKDCKHCKIKFRMLYNQIMSPLPIERIKPCPPFTNVGIDYFGPFPIKGEVQKRIRGKGYGVLIACMTSRAVHVDVAHDYSTDGLLQVLRRFASVRGWPSKIFSDQGTQLVSASKELKKTISTLDWRQIREYGHGNGVEWCFSPADAPWYNGATEALVKTVKKALSAAIGENVMKFSELQTCMFEAAQLVNQRPIGMHPSSPDEEQFLCPNDLLLGRASSKVPQGPFKEHVNEKNRFNFIQSIAATFWKRWIREVFPNLVTQPKWHTEYRNLKAGDVVLVQDANAVRGQWKMAVVERALDSKDNKVRKVRIMYKSNDGTYSRVDRAVQRLIVLVANDD